MPEVLLLGPILGFIVGALLGPYLRVSRQSSEVRQRDPRRAIIEVRYSRITASIGVEKDGRVTDLIIGRDHFANLTRSPALNYVRLFGLREEGATEEDLCRAMARGLGAVFAAGITSQQEELLARSIPELEVGAISPP